MNELCAAGFPSARLVLSILGFFGMVNCYTLRVNLSVAIVAMVNSTYLHELELSARDSNDTETGSVCAADGHDANKTVVLEDDVRMIIWFYVYVYSPRR